MNDSDFDGAWREFAKDDAETRAPARLRPAVMRGWDEAHEAQPDRVEVRFSAGRRISLMAMLGAAAAAIVVVGITVREQNGGPVPHPTPAKVPPVTEATSATAPNRVPEQDRHAVRHRTGIETAPPVRPTIAHVTNAPVDAFRLIADPTFDTESFEIVRLRLPRTSLEAIGVALIGPEITSLVDVDVVVGGDGLPRAIRSIRPVVGIQ
jgi:hypothetical protein